MQFLATSPYYNSTTYTSCESRGNIYFLTASYLTTIEKITTNHITNLYSGLQLVLTKVIVRAMVILSQEKYLKQ